MKKAFLLLFLGTSLSFYAQKSFTDSQAQSYIQNRSVKEGLSKHDVSHTKITDSYTSGGIKHVYVQQYFNNYPIESAIYGVHSKDNEVFYASHRFISNIAEKTTDYYPSITSDQALKVVLENHQIYTIPPKKQIDKPNTWHYESTKELMHNPEVSLCYIPQNNKLHLAYRVLVHLKEKDQKWVYFVHAKSSAIIDKQSWTKHCAFEKDAFMNQNKTSTETPIGTSASSSSADGSSYRVFELPIESPIHGNRTVVTDPSDQVSSPFGWHDTDGAQGPEYTITRGNNVHAYEDRDGNGSSSGNEPDGGTNLLFDTPFNLSMTTNQETDAATVQLFYTMNMIHDISYRHGFDAASGNFQQNNYGQGGLSGDPIDARAQSGLEVGEINNANYVHSTEGFSPTVNMYIWSNEDNGLVTVNAPSNLAGTYSTGGGDFGGQITSTPLTATVAVVEDNTPNPLYSDGCETIQNDLTGKIAIVDRGTCEFGFKALAVENQGAVGCIICNFEDQIIGMAPGAVGDQVTIPTVFMKKSDCDLIREFAGAGLEISLVDPGIADTLDGDFDNGIIMHEYAHGISTRLTGGPTQSCLFNDEEMGEGWSDFFGLALTVEQGDQGTDARGIGTFVNEESPNGIGIRNYPYSTDMTISPLTYADVANVFVDEDDIPSTHAIGEIWCNMLWDMYWAFVEQYGFSADLFSGNSGNNMAIKLVIEGMKLQSCDPGFIDGRDAIIAADQALYSGNNKCLIQEVFARRGLGINASQGSPYSHTDGLADFLTDPLCTPELKIEKTVTEIVNPTDPIQVTLTIDNHVNTLQTSVVVVDTIPSGLSVIAGSESMAFSQQGNRLEFVLPDMAYQDQVVVSYQLNTTDQDASTEIFKDEVTLDSDDLIWESVFNDVNSFYEWIITGNSFHSPNFSLYAQSLSESTDITYKLRDPISISGNHPTLSFWHKYNTQAGFDGGVVDYSLDGLIWQPLEDAFFKNAYNSNLDYQTFVVPNLRGFSGHSDGWIASYADLNFLNGEDVYFRLRFGTNDSIAVDGWYVDDFQIIDLVSFSSGACVSSDQSPMACSFPKDRGSLMNIENQTTPPDTTNPGGEEPNSITEHSNNALQIYPNPTNEDVFVVNPTNKAIDHIQVTAPNGALIVEFTPTKTIEKIALDQYASGVYFIHVTWQNGYNEIKKVFKR